MTHSSFRPAARLGEGRRSIFDRMNRLAEQHGAVNLGQGYPDFMAPEFLRAAAVSVVGAGNEQYARIAGDPALRAAISAYLHMRGGPEADPDSEITITCGCQEALAATLFALVDPGDEVVVFEPYFETYPLCVALTGGVSRFVTLRPPDFAVREDELRAVLGPRTRVFIVNTPHNPTGRVFSREELSIIARLSIEYDAMVITDEVYEEIVFEGTHVRMATMPDMRERTVTLSSLGKTFSATGWKIGWAVAPRSVTDAIRRAHQALCYSIVKPLQLAAVHALGAPASYFDSLRDGYRRRRDLLTRGLRRVGFTVYEPEGTYFLLADHAEFGLGNDEEFAEYLTAHVGVTGIPPSHFYHDPATGRRLIRFAFCKTDEVLEEAVRRMERLRHRGESARPR